MDCLNPSTLTPEPTYHVGDVLPLRLQQQVQRHAALAELAHVEQRRDDVAALTIVDQQLPLLVYVLRWIDFGFRA